MIVTLRQYIYPFAAVLLIGLSSLSCASRRPFIEPPKAAEEVVIGEHGDAKGLLLRAYGEMKSIKASGEILLGLQNEERKPASLVLILEKPAKLRMRAYRPLVSSLFDLVSDGSACWLYLPSERTAYLNDDCNALNDSGTAPFVSAAMLVAALTVIADPAKLRDAPAEISQEEGLTRLEFAENGGGERRIWLDSRTGLAVRQLFISKDGVTQADISYREQKLYGNTVIPVAVEIVLPQRHMSILIQLTDLKTDPAIPADAFEFSPPENTRIVKSRDVVRQ